MIVNLKIIDDVCANNAFFNWTCYVLFSTIFHTGVIVWSTSPFLMIYYFHFRINIGIPTKVLYTPSVIQKSLFSKNLKALTRGIKRMLDYFYFKKPKGLFTHLQLLITNVLSVCFLSWTFVTDLLIHIHQKEKIALEITLKVASVNGP